MTRQRIVLGFAASLACGCATDMGELLEDKRPPVNPAPTNVQQEIRDARYFLSLPDEPIGPATGFVPREVRTSIESGIQK